MPIRRGSRMLELVGTVCGRRPPGPGAGGRERYVPIRRSAVVARLAGALALVGAVVLGPPLVAPHAFGACAAAGGGTVAIVVDFGDVAGSPGHVVVRCVPSGSSKTGAQVLADAGFAVRYDPGSGLLCGIDGFPASGCGDRTGAGRDFSYWAYWRAPAGSSQWTYASIGPGSARVKAGDVEGWRYVRGSASPSDPPPRRSPVPASLCPAPDPAPPPGPAPAGPASPGDPPPAGGSGGGSAPGEPAGPTGSEPDDGALATGAPGAPDDQPDEDGTTDAGDGDAVGDGDPAAEGPANSEALDAGQQALVETADADRGTPWGLIAGAVLVVGFGAAAVVRFRKPSPSS
jgi:hypothetical protein